MAARSQKGLTVAALSRDRYGQVDYIVKNQGCHGVVAVSTGDRYGQVTAKAGSTVYIYIYIYRERERERERNRERKKRKT